MLTDLALLALQLRRYAPTEESLMYCVSLGRFNGRSLTTPHPQTCGLAKQTVTCDRLVA